MPNAAYVVLKQDLDKKSCRKIFNKVSKIDGVTKAEVYEKPQYSQILIHCQDGKMDDIRAKAEKIKGVSAFTEICRK